MVKSPRGQHIARFIHKRKKMAETKWPPGPKYLTTLKFGNQILISQKPRGSTYPTQRVLLRTCPDIFIINY